MAKTKPRIGRGQYHHDPRARLPTGWSLWPESTIALDATNAPLPDFAVIRSGDLLAAAPDRYPGPSDVGLLIEVAVTTLRDDLSTVLEHYARALIPVYWVVDIPGRRILVHTEPRVVDGLGEYARVETYRPGQSLPLVLDGGSRPYSVRRTAALIRPTDAGAGGERGGAVRRQEGTGLGHCVRAVHERIAYGVYVVLGAWVGTPPPVLRALRAEYRPQAPSNLCGCD